MVYARRMAKKTKSKPVGIPTHGDTHICACGHREPCDYDLCNGTAVIPCNHCLMGMSIGEHMDAVTDSELLQHYSKSTRLAFTNPNQYRPYPHRHR